MANIEHETNEEKLRCPICLVGQLQWQYVEGIGADMWKCTDAGRGWNADQSVYGYCGISLEEPVIMNIDCIMCGSVHPDNYPSTAAETEAHNGLTRANNDRKRGILNKDMESRIKASVKASGISQSWIDKNLKSLHVEVE